jgi:hypothetical protein
VTAPLGNQGLASGGTARGSAAGSGERLNAGRGGRGAGHEAAGGGGGASVRGMGVSTGGGDLSGHAGGSGERSDSRDRGALRALAVAIGTAVTTSSLVVGGSGGSGRGLERDISSV